MKGLEEVVHVDGQWMATCWGRAPQGSLPPMRTFYLRIDKERKHPMRMERKYNHDGVEYNPAIELLHFQPCDREWRDKLAAQKKKVLEQRKKDSKKVESAKRQTRREQQAARETNPDAARAEASAQRQARREKQQKAGPTWSFQAYSCSGDDGGEHRNARVAQAQASRHERLKGDRRRDQVRAAAARRLENVKKIGAYSRRDPAWPPPGNAARPPVEQLNTYFDELKKLSDGVGQHAVTTCPHCGERCFDHMRNPAEPPETATDKLEERYTKMCWYCKKNPTVFSEESIPLDMTPPDTSNMNDYEKANLTSDQQSRCS